MKKTSFLTICLLFISISILSAQGWKSVSGKGPKVRKEVNLKSFDGFAVGIAADVVVEQGSRQEVVIEAQQNIIDLIDWQVSGSRLKIGNRNKTGFRNAKIKIYITIPTLDEVTIAGSGEVIGKGHFDNLDELTVAVSGSGNIQLSFDAKELNSRISGSGHVQLKGNAKNVKLKITGSGAFDGYNLESDECDVTITGSGDARVHTHHDLTAKITGSGSVKYKGDPSVRSKITGSGDVHSKG